MRRATDIFQLAWRAHRLSSYVPRRGLKFQVDIKWVYPVRKPFYHPENSGDLAAMNYPKRESIHYKFEKSEELTDADETVKKIFSFEYQPPSEAFRTYERELVEKVKRHEYDNDSEEVKIARMTAKIRYLQPIILKVGSRGKHRRWLKELVEKRRKHLKCLRLIDYKRFEWLLEKLDLVYKPQLENSGVVTRKKSLTLLANLDVLKKKEEKVAALKKELDEQKIPFLQKKLEKLKWIKEMEEKNNLESTVNEADIEECVNKLKEVELQVAENQRLGYVRKVHPYTLELYHEKLLREREAIGAQKQS